MDSSRGFLGGGRAVGGGIWPVKPLETAAVIRGNAEVYKSASLIINGVYSLLF